MKERLFLCLLLPELDLSQDNFPHGLISEDLKELSLQHGLFPLLYTQIKRKRELLPPGLSSEFLSKYNHLFLKSVTFSAINESVEKYTLSLLQQNSIDAIVIKGSILTENIYKDPNCRVSSDIDILVRREDVFSVESLLLDNGYKQEDNLSLRYCLSRIHHVSYVHATGVNVEIHWNFGIPYFFDITSKAIWSEVAKDRCGHLRLTDEMLLVMLFVHHHSHSFRELRTLVDILWALHRFKETMDYDSLADRITRFGLARVVKLAIFQISRLWPVYYHCSGIKELADKFGDIKLHPLVSRYFDMRFDKRAKKSIYRDKFMARLLLKNKLRFFISLIRTVIPPRIAIEEIYGESGMLALPVKYIRFIMWRLKEWFGL